MAITVRISRSDGQWVAEVPRARGFIASSSSLERLRKQVERGLKEFYPAIARESRREKFDLPEADVILKDLAKAEDAAQRAQKHVSVVKKQASQRLRSRLGISVREVGTLMGVSGGRVQQLLKGG
jgi:predicted RNase H-like HicB family nuclease